MNWWTSSHKNSDDKTISIDEKNLMKVLKGEDYDTYKRPSAKFTFRF